MVLRKVLCTVCTILVLHRAQCAGPPKVNSSYIAWGELTVPIKELVGEEMQAAFEESYDADSQNSAFVVWMNGNNVTFVQNFKTNQTFRYTEGKDCALTDETEWVESEYPPGLIKYETDDGHVKFSLRQLFNLPEKYLVAHRSDVPDTYRGVPARKWLYEIQGKEQNGLKQKLAIYAFWSDGDWKTSSNDDKIPLGYIVSKVLYSSKGVSSEEVVTSVFGFVPGTYNRKLLQAYQGIICANRLQTRKFPNVQNIKAIAIHSELILPDFKEIKYVDTYFDPRNHLVRIDVERFREEDPVEEMKTKRYESEIAVGKMGVVFRQSTFKDRFNCEVIPFQNYTNDLQNFFDLKQNFSKWKMGKLFGLNDTTYVYTGKTVKRDIPCHVFQGIRTDWPEKSANVTSLWEWCFNTNMSKENDLVLFLNDEVGLINAEVKILSSDMPQVYPVGFRMFHHFYEVAARDPDILDATRFDISRCFSENLKRSLQFYLDYEITEENRHLVENLTSDVSFLQKWKSAIYLNTEIPSYTLRIAKLLATIEDNKIYIKFIILDKHPGLPAEILEDQITSLNAERKLKINVHQGFVSVTHWFRNGVALTFAVVEHSIKSQINTTFDHHTIRPPPPPKSTPSTHRTKLPFTLRTEPKHNSTKTQVTNSVSTVSGITSQTEQTSSVSSPKPTVQTIKYSGNQPGTVVAVSIAMVLVGITIGISGTFYKYYGFPSCSGTESPTEPTRRKLTLTSIIK